ncbi:MAG: lysylphosphatidylglycerol synthase transmembrane domain-containing protein [Patescibacteria group bacterium]
MKNRRFLSRLFLLLGLILGGGLLLALIKQTGPQDLLDSLVAFGWLPLLGFIGISLLNFGLYTWRWKLILDDMVEPKQRVSFPRLFMHRMSGYAAGYLTPAAQVAGEPIRVAMVKSDGVPLQPATSSVVLDLAFEITSFVVYVIAGLALAFAQGLGAGGDLLLPLVFVLVLLGILGSFFIFTVSGAGFFHRLISGLGLRRLKFMQKFETWLEGTEKLMTKFFVGKGAKVLFIVLLSFVMTAFRAVEIVFITHFFGFEVTVRDAFLMSTLPGVALLLPIPGGLGVFEGSNAAMFALLGIGINPIAFTMIVRSRDLLFIAIGVVHAVLRGEKIIYAKRT